MKKVVFLENFSPAIEKNGQLISLSPEASYFLEKNKIKYNILEDYYDERKLREKEEDYFFDQLKWFSTFDNFIKEHISWCREYNIPLARANYYRLKFFVDTIIINSFILNYFFQNNQDIKEVVYYSQPFISEREKSIFSFEFENREAFSDLLQLFCQKYKISFSKHFLELKGSIPSKSFLNTLQKNSFVKSPMKKLFNFVKYKKFRKIIPFKSSLPDLRVLFMHAGSVDIDYPLQKLMGDRANIYLKEDKKIIREDSFLRKLVKIPPLDNYFLKGLKEECDSCANQLEQNFKIISWINDKCSVNVSSIILPFLKYFIAEDCFYILKEAKRMFDFYQQNKIDYVFARGNSDRESLGPLIAAKYIKGAKSICTQHSSFAMDMEIFGVFETETYNYTFTRDSISQNYFEYSLANRYQTDCKIIQLPYYLKRIEKKYSKKKKERKREKVVYVEKMSFDKLRCFNDLDYPISWYFEFQKELIIFFAKENFFDFIYKLASWSEYIWTENYIFHYLRERRDRNISIFERHFLKSLKFADRIIVNYPSGALFEAAAAGKPVLCIYANYLKIIKEAKEVFGKSLQPFSSTEEAISIIKEFLYTNPEDYIVKLPWLEKNFIDVFKEIVEKEKGGDF